MLLAPLPPGARLTLAGVAESVKLAGTGTVIAMTVLLVVAPEVPVTVMVEVPGAALAEARNVSVVMRVVVAGLNVAETPVGRPATEKVTGPLKLPCGVTVMVLAPLPPCGIVRLAGDGVIV